MWSDALAEFTMLPLEPVTVSVLLPFLALLLVEAWSMEVALVMLAVSPNEVGVSVSASPVLAPLTLSPTVPVKPFCAVTVTVYLTICPRFTDCELGEMLIVNVG